jgi:hypothetical protein
MRIITGGISSGWMREDGMWLVCWEVTGLFATGVVVIRALERGVFDGVSV